MNRAAFPFMLVKHALKRTAHSLKCFSDFVFADGIMQPVHAGLKIRNFSSLFLACATRPMPCMRCMLRKRGKKRKPAYFAADFLEDSLMARLMASAVILKATCSMATLVFTLNCLGRRLPFFCAWSRSCLV